METAVTVAWDAGIGVGDSVLVVGAGVLGLLVAALAARVPGTAVTVVDVDPARAGIAARAGARFAAADSAPREQDVVIHTSGASAGLALALAAAGDEATVVEASWYGDAAVSLALGEAFHARRLKLVSSQVGRIPPGRAPRWSHRRRIAAALDLLRDPLFESFVTATIDFADAPAHVPAALAPGSSGLMTVLRYAV
jgi:threonine dehydrogenase-like Zn-dependent dehydrogenase